MDQANYVCLRFSTRDVGHDVHFKEGLSDDVVDTSSVLSNVVEGVGEADMPDCISLGDFTTWMAAVDAHKTITEPISLSSFCAAVKVRLCCLLTRAPPSHVLDTRESIRETDIQKLR